MNILPIQNDIVSTLQAAFTAATLPYNAFNLPDVPSDVQKAVAAPIVFVAYMGSTADPSMDSRTIMQNRKLKFNVEIQSRRLNGDNGLFAARDVVEQVIIGYSPLYCSKLYLVKDDILQSDDGVWVHIYNLETSVVLVQKDENDPIIVPSFQEIIENSSDAEEQNDVNSITYDNI